MFKFRKKSHQEVLDNIPNHIGIIMDGNGRWAKKRLQPRVMGHKAGMDAVSYTHLFKSVIFWAISIGLVGMLSGIFISYYWETPASATITLIFIAFFGLVSIFRPLLKAE